MALHQSGEDYLEAILLLQKEKEMVRSVDVARHMGVSKPSVCHAVNSLKDGGFLVMDEDRFLHLIDAGVEPKTAEQDACRMEHAISDNSFQKMKEGLQNK